MNYSGLLLGGMLAAVALTNAAAQDLRVSGQTSTNPLHVAVEKAFYDKLGEAVGADFTINYASVDVLGINTFDLLRLVRTGTFDIVQATPGEAAKDDPFLEGVDLIGVSPSFEDLKMAIDAYREPLSKRIEEKFNAKTLALWPFGPQVFYCAPEITSLADLKGMKVRSYTESMAKLLEGLGAIPVSMAYAEVYPSLQRKVVDCAITSPTSGNTGKWAEVTKYYMPLGINWSVNGHFMNLDTWNKLPKPVQEKMTAQFAILEKQLWDLAAETTVEAGNCNVGATPCTRHTSFKMNLVKPTKADEETLRHAVNDVILPSWGKNCDAAYPGCSTVWNDTVGKVRGFHIN